MTFGTGGETIFPDSLSCSVLSAVPQGWRVEKAMHHWRGQQGLQRSGAAWWVAESQHVPKGWPQTWCRLYQHPGQLR